MNATTATVTTAAYNSATGVFEVIDIEQLPAPLDLSEVELSSQDLGCEPGALYRVAILDEDDIEVDAVEITAS